MYDAGKVALGLLLFVVLATSPIWHGALFGRARAEVELPDDVPEGCAAAVDPLIAAGELVPEDREERRRIARIEHPSLLVEWRDEVVREGLRFRETWDRDPHREKSLSRTCLGCHANKERFCDRCHETTGVSPTCWDCHADPAAVAGR